MAFISPVPEFSTPPLSAPPPGLEAGIDYDLSEYFNRFALSANEPREKLKSLLTALAKYQDVQIKSAGGKRLFVLARYIGNDSIDDQPPFTVTLINKGTSGYPDYHVTVSDGRVIERDLTQEEGYDAIIYHAPSNNRSGDELKEFQISQGQSVYIKINEDEDGSLSSETCEVKIGEDGLISKNNIPEVQDGEYYYKLAKLENGELTKYATGSHIYHSSGLSADFKLMNCGEVGIDGNYLTNPEQIARLTFLSGKLIKVGNQTEEERKYFSNVFELNVNNCSSTSVYSMP